MVTADTHLVPTPPATQGSSSRSARPQGGCILAGGGPSFLCSSGPGTQGSQPLLCSAGQDLGFARSWWAPGSRHRGHSRIGELGNVWSCEWLGAPWRETLLGEAPRAPARAGRGGRAHLAGTRLQDDPRSIQLQFIACCSGGTSDTHAFQAWDKSGALLSSRD